MTDHLKGVKYDTARCAILQSLIEMEYNDSVWIVYNRELRNISEKHLQDKDPGMKRYFASYYSAALGNFGYLFTQANDFDKAEAYLNDAAKILKELDNKEGLAGTYTNLGYLMRHKGNSNKALDYYFAAFKILEAMHSKAGMAVCYNNIGYVHETMEDFDKALDYFKKSAQLYEEAKEKSDGLSVAYGNIGALLSRHADVACGTTTRECDREAIRYLKMAIRIQREMKNYQKLSGSLNTLGGIYFEKGDPDCEGMSECKQKSLQKALEYLNEALEIRKEIKDTLGLAQSCGSLALFMLGQNKLDKALEYGEASMDFSKKMEVPEQIVDAARVLKMIYQKKNNYKKALEMSDLYLRMKDSIDNEAIRKANLKKQFQSEYEIQAAKDSVISASRIKEERFKHQQAITQQKTYTYGGFIGLALMLIVAVVSFRAYRNKQKANVIITEQKQLAEMQKRIIEEKQKEILDSINYAKRIQKAHLPNEKFLSKKLSELKNKGGS
jgi:tetratricopeptide (TPR) repeat protein